MVRVEFFFDVSSPWTYLAFHNIQAMAKRLDVAIEWRPFLVGGVFNTVNDSVYKSRENPVPAKAAYMAKDLADWASRAGLTILWHPSIFPVNSVKAMRGCLVAQREGRLVPFAQAAFDAYWSRDEDIADPDVLAGLAGRTGLEAKSFLAGIGEQSIKDLLRANTDELIARGGFGSPTIFVNTDDMYFGNDRLALIEEAIARACNSEAS